MIGVCRVSSRPRISLAVSNPSRPGICTSSRTTANGLSSSRRNASPPDCASTKVRSSPSRTALSARRLAGSSSTSSTLAWDGPLVADMPTLPCRTAWTVPCRFGLHRRAVEYLLHRPVTVAGGGFQPLPVENGELPPAVPDEARLLKAARRQGDALPVRPQHLRQELLRDLERVGPHPVV